MSVHEAQRVVLPLYPDEYIVEEDEMGESGPQDTSIRYFSQVLEYYYRRERWAIMVNRNHYHYAIKNSQHLIVPDISIAKDIPIPPEEQPYIISWDMRPDKGNRPPPPLVIEFASKETYEGDIKPDNKPRLYGLVGVKEYFAYDPNEPRVWPKKMGKRLLGWRYDEQGRLHEIQPDKRGWLWSEVLEGWLAEDGVYLRFYDKHGQLQRPGWESEALLREAEEAARHREEAARLRAEQRATEQEARAQAEIIARQEAERRLEELNRQLEELRRHQEQG